MNRCVVIVTLYLGLNVASLAIAGDGIYVAHDGDGTPRFSTQPYDSRYSLYLRNPETMTVSKAATPISSIAARRIAMVPHILRVAKEHAMDPALIVAVAEVESGFNAKAVSPKGAIGAMQLAPKTASNYGVTNPYDLQQNLDGGARYLKDLLAAHHGSLPLALAAYNAGKSNVARHNQRIPPFDETMLYVPRVLAKMAEYRHGDEMRAK